MDIDNLQPIISDKIQTIVNSNKISNAYLLCGPKGSGKEALALQFCSLLTGFDSDEFINNQNIFLVIPGSSDFYLNLFKSSKIDQKEYQEWGHYWREKLLFPLEKIPNGNPIIGIFVIYKTIGCAITLSLLIIFILSLAK